MRTEQLIRCRFEDELSGLVARKHCFDDARSRHTLFDALIDLEVRAQVGGAPEPTLRKIAESRFLAGILREAVRPVSPTPLRTILRLRGRGNGRVLAAAETGDR